MPLYKLYTYAGQEDGDPPVLGRNGLLPRVCTASDEDAVEWAHAVISGHDDICCFELVCVNQDGSNGSAVYQEGEHFLAAPKE